MSPLVLQSWAAREGVTDVSILPGRVCVAVTSAAKAAEFAALRTGAKVLYYPADADFPAEDPESWTVVFEVTP